MTEPGPQRAVGAAGDVPSWVGWLFWLVTGLCYPALKVGVALEVAGLTRGHAAGARAVAEGVRRDGTVAAAAAGPTLAGSIGAAASQSADTAEAQADGLDQLASYLEQVADAALELRTQALMFLGQLAAGFAFSFALSVTGAGPWLEALVAESRIVKAILETAWGKLAWAASRQIAPQVAAQVALGAAIQGAEMGLGITRTWSWAEFGEDFAIGAWAAPTALVKAVPDALGDLADQAGDGLAGLAARLALHSGADALHTWFHEYSYSELAGQGSDNNPGAASYGAAGHLLHRGAHAAGITLNPPRSLPPSRAAQPFVITIPAITQTIPATTQVIAAPVPAVRPSPGPIEVSAGANRSVHLWLGAPAPPALSSRLGLTREGMLVLHGQGRNGTLPAPASLVSATIAQAKLTNALTSALLLLCAQRATQQFATEHALTTWGTPDDVWVSPATGALFIGRASLAVDGRLRTTAAGTLRRYDPGGHGPVTNPGPPPIALLTPRQATGHPATDWQHRASQPDQPRRSPSIALRPVPRRPSGSPAAGPAESPESPEPQSRPEPGLEGPRRALPPLFGVRYGGHPQYPTGYLGTFVKLGTALFRDHQATADLVAVSLPPGSESLREAVGGQVKEYLRQHGDQAFAQAIAGGRLPFTVPPDGTPGHAARTVTVGLALGDRAQARQIPEPDRGPVPEGQRVSLPWDSEQTVAAGSIRTATSTRGLSAGPRVDIAGRARLDGRLGASSATAYTRTTSAATADKRFLKGAHTGDELAFFRLPEGRLVVRPDGPPGDEELAGRRLPVVVGFPESLCPPRGWRPLSDQRLGVTQGQVDRDEAVGYDSVHDQEVRASQAAARIAAVLGQVAHARESVVGLPQLARDVWERLAREVSTASQAHRGDIASNLSESTVLRRWPDITGPGFVTPVIGQSQHGPRLIVTARLRHVQALTEVDAPVRQERMRLSGATDARADTGTVSVSASAAGRPRTGEITASGRKVRVRGAGQGSVDGTLSSTRQETATISYADIRALVHRGPSIQYRAELHVVVKIAGDSAAEAMPAVRGDIAALIRIPRRERDRFDFLIREAVSPTGARPPRDDEPGGLPDDRYPPADIASGKGLGFAGISALAGLEDLIPGILRVVMDLDGRTAWAQPWSGRAYADAFAQLTPDFTVEALAAAALAPVAALRAEWSRPATEGDELISAQVTLTRDREPASSGRAADITLVISSTSGQGGVSSGETDISSLNVEGAAGLELDYDLGGGLSGRFAAAGGGGLSITSTTGTHVGYSQARFPVMTYRGPARHWDYGLAIDLDVSVRHEHGTAPADWVPVLVNAVRDRFARHGRPTGAGRESIPLLTLGDDPDLLTRHEQRTGSVRLGVPEPMAPARPVPQHILDETGAVQVIRNPPRPPNPAARATTWQKAVRQLLPRQWQPRGGQLFRTVPMPDLRPYLGPGGLVRLDTDDRIVEILGAPDVGATLRELLAEGGIREATYGNLPWTVTEPGQLATAMADGPSLIMTTVVQDGRVTGRHATIKIAGYPARLPPQSPGPEPAGGWRVSAPVVLSAEETDLGGPLFSATVIKQWAGNLTFTAALEHLAAPGDVPIDVPDLSYTWSLAPVIRPRTVTDAPAPGRQIHETRPRRQHTEDMIWVITVVFHDKNVVYRSLPSYSGAIVTVRRSITFLRPAEPILDPRIASGLPPAGTVRLLRAGYLAPGLRPTSHRPQATEPRPEPAPRAGIRLIPMVPLTPGSSQLIPALPVLPILSVSEALLPLPGPGGDEPLVYAVRRELEARAPGHLEDHWTLEADGLPAHRELPAPLHRVFRRRFVGSIMDTVLGAWVVARTTRPLGASHEVAEIWFRGRRIAGEPWDPDGGYKFMEHAPEVEFGRDIWGRHIVRAGRPWLFSRSGQTSGQAGPWLTGAGVNPVTQLNKAGGRGTTDAIWDSILLKGADRYGGFIKFDVVVIKTVQPSRAANGILLNLPRHILGPPQKAGNLLSQRPSRTVIMAERALVPRALNNDRALQPVTPPGAAAIEPVPPHAAVVGRVLDVSPDDLRSRNVYSLDWDREKLQELNLLVLRDLARLEHIGGVVIPWVGSVFEHGAATLPVAAGLISYSVFQAYLPEMVAKAGRALPTLTREGGPVTDTSRGLTLHVQFLDPQPGRFPIDGTLSYSTYHLAERQPQLFHTHGLSGDLITTPAGLASVTGTAGASVQRGANSDLKLMPLTRMQAHTRPVNDWPVSVDALITVTVRFRNSRGMIDVPSRPRARLRYRVRNVLVLGFSPWASRKYGFDHPVWG